MHCTAVSLQFLFKFGRRLLKVVSKEKSNQVIICELQAREPIRGEPKHETDAEMDWDIPTPTPGLEKGLPHSSSVVSRKKKKVSYLLC